MHRESIFMIFSNLPALSNAGNEDKNGKNRQNFEVKIFNFFRCLGPNLGKGGGLWQMKPQKL